MNKLAWLPTIVTLFAYSCGGTETQNPADSPAALRSFKDSGCKKETKALSGGETASATQALVSTDYNAETTGLKCIAWEVLEANRVKVDLINWESACGPKFVGYASLKDIGALNLLLSNPGCLIARCGSCIYDWSFEVQGIDATKPLPLGVAIDVCPGDDAAEKQGASYPIVSQQVSLPIDARVSGILCNYADFGALGWQAQALSECGTYAMPCNDAPNSMCSTGIGSAQPSCQGDLVCSNNGNPEQRICAKPCANDTDCGSLGVLTCDGGLCRPIAGW